MTEYNGQIAEGLYQDYMFLKAAITELETLLRNEEEHPEDPISTEEFGLYWLTTLRAKGYDITLPEPTVVSTYLAAREVARETKRLHSKQMVAYIRMNIDRKEKE